MSAIWSQTTEEGGGVTVIHFSEEKIIDDVKIQQIAKELNEAIDKAEKQRVLINFDRVKFMSSAMIGKLILLGKRCKNESRELKFCSIIPNIMEVFKIMKLHKVFALYDDEPKAMKAFEGGGGWFS